VIHPESSVRPGGRDPVRLPRRRGSGFGGLATRSW
jgi:hypothetical protein